MKTLKEIIQQYVSEEGAHVSSFAITENVKAGTVIKAKSPSELKAAIYKKEGLTHVVGDNKSRNIMALYNIVSDQKSNRLIATKKSEDELKAPPGPRTAWEKIAGKKKI